MRTLDAATLALYTSQRFDSHLRIEVSNGSGTIIPLITSSGSRVKSFRLEHPNPNLPIGALTVDFVRDTTNPTQSLAPFVTASAYNRLADTVTFSPLLQVGRLVTMWVALTAERGARPADGSGLWYQVFRGTIASVRWPQYAGRTASITCTDIAGLLQKAKSEASHTYTAGTAVETVIQQILNNNGYGGFTFSCPVPTGKVIPSDVQPGVQKTVWEQIAQLVRGIGWLAWIRYTGTAVDALTVFEPPRSKIVVDQTISVKNEFTELEINESEISNVLYVRYWDTDGILREVGPANGLEDAASIDRYGNIRRVSWIVLEQDSPVREEADAIALGQAALADVSDPDILATVNCPPLWFAETGVDLYTLTADEGRLFDTDQNGAPFAITTSGSAAELPSSSVAVRGKPSSGRKTWSIAGSVEVSLSVFAEAGTDQYTIYWNGENVLLSVDGGEYVAPPVSPFTVTRSTQDQTYVFRAARGGKTTTRAITVPAAGNESSGLVNFREFEDTTGTTTLAWDSVGWLVNEVWAGDVLFDLPLPSDPWAVVRGTMLPLPSSTLTLSYPKPGEGQRRLVQVQTLLSDGSDGMVYRFNQFGTPAPLDWRAEAEEAGGNVTLTVRLDDSRGVVSTVDFYTLVLGVRSGPLSATSTGTGYYALTLPLDPKHVVGIQPEIVRNDGLPPILGEMYTSDIDKDATIESVRKTRDATTVVDTVLVDADTDTAGLFYREDVGGMLGTETTIAPRGTDPRYGSFTVTAAATERKFRVYGKNAAGSAGDYFDLRIEPAPVVQPAITGIWLSVVNHPNSGGPGYSDVHDVSWDLSTAVNDATHGISVSFYTSGVLVTTQTATPSFGSVTYAAPVGGSTVRSHYAKVSVYTLTGGGTLNSMESVPVATTIDTTPYP